MSKPVYLKDIVAGFLDILRFRQIPWVAYFVCLERMASCWAPSLEPIKEHETHQPTKLHSTYDPDPDLTTSQVSEVDSIISLDDDDEEDYQKYIAPVHQNNSITDYDEQTNDLFRQISNQKINTDRFNDEIVSDSPSIFSIYSDEWPINQNYKVNQIKPFLKRYISLRARGAHLY